MSSRDIGDFKWSFKKIKRGELKMGKDILEGKSAVMSVFRDTEIVGHLCWYSVGDDLYEREKLRQSLLINGIEEKYLPKPVRSTDAFRRATKAVECKRKDDSVR